jgi:5'-nucleotidase
MHILITNDDGVTAPGLLALAQAMRQLGQVSIVAPDHDWSGCGHIKHFKRPLRIQEVTLADGTTAFATDGSPADCVALAAMGLLNEPVDLVVSGINNDANVGYDLTYSGTVAAAKEALIWQIPGIAISIDSQRQPDPNYNLAASVVSQVVQTIRSIELPNNIAFNINVPNIPTELYKGMQLTQTGDRVYRDNLVKRTDPRGNSYYWIGGDIPTGILQEGTDYSAITQGYASITPIHLDYTAYYMWPLMAEWGLSQPASPSTNGNHAETAVSLPV